MVKYKYMSPHLTIIELAKMGGKASVKKRFANMSKKEKSEYMKKVRGGVKLKCPKCGSSKIRTGYNNGYAKNKLESLPAKKMKRNECLESKCKYQWD